LEKKVRNHGIHFTGAEFFDQNRSKIEDVCEFSRAYNAPRADDTLEDLSHLQDILSWIRSKNVLEDFDTRTQFLEDLCIKILAADGAPYVMLPSLRELLIKLEEGDVDIFVYVLLCPLGRCAGVSRDTVTGSFFKVIEEGVEAGLKTTLLILSLAYSQWKLKSGYGKMFMCYELVHYCLKLLAPNFTDRSNSAPYVEVHAAGKGRGGEDVVLTEPEKKKGKRKAMDSSTAIAIDDTQIDAETPVKKVLHSILVTF